ncbi:hypothetical protein KFU94_59335 [Chloroflexi bacterium TSY]|nr:hypothetical protein [Chloroflexi bacterium TSY]
MQTSTYPLRQPLQPPAIWQTLANTNRFLALNLFVYVTLFLFTIGASMVDSRLIAGAPAWIKPMKFAISSFLYVGTLLWMLSFVRSKPRLVNVVAIVTAIAFLVELSGISLQAFRGVRSHFNVSTTLNAAIFSMMGFFVILIWCMNLLAAILLMLEPLKDRAFAWSLRLALVITVIGGGLGGLMTSGPTPTQAAALEAGETVTFIGAHSVGVEDGGPGLPFTNWSTEGGDLRIGHFVGLHGLQAIPLLGIFIRRRWGKRLSINRQTALIFIGSAGYLGLTLLFTWQALRGQPLIAPDGLTLGAMAALILTIVFGFWMILRKDFSIDIPHPTAV